MKKIIIACLLLVAQVSRAQGTDTAFNNRLEQYMQLNRQLKFGELMEYIHPALFKLVTREQMVEVFQKSFNNPQFRLSIDSIAVVRLSPVFRLGSAQYIKVDYYMEMQLRFNDPSFLESEATRKQMIGLLQTGFEGATVSFLEAGKSFLIKAGNNMIGIKDNAATPWMFLGAEKKQEAMVKQIFPAEVISHFKLL